MNAPASKPERMPLSRALSLIQLHTGTALFADGNVIYTRRTTPAGFEVLTPLSKTDRLYVLAMLHAIEQHRQKRPLSEILGDMVTFGLKGLEHSSDPLDIRELLTIIERHEP